MNCCLIARNLAVACVMVALGSGCFVKNPQGSRSGGSSGGSAGPGTTNRAPTISGAPPTSIRVGEAYVFQPTASDPDGDALTFQIQNQPVWATFDSARGRLSGRPGDADVGTFSNVRITVSDGRAQASLRAFAIAVNQIALGSVTLAWTPPTTNADGTALTDLAGYRIYYGRSATSLNQMITISNVGTTRWVVGNLSPATWYFAMTSYKTTGVESKRTSTVSTKVT